MATPRELEDGARELVVTARELEDGARELEDGAQEQIAKMWEFTFEARELLVNARE